MSRRYQVNSSRVVHDTLDGEVIAIRNDTGAYYSMAGTAASVWVLLGGGADIETAVSKICAHHSLTAGETTDEVARAVQEFGDRLVELQLFIPSTADAVGPLADLPTETAGSPWANPAIEEFNDMADLLLFDPIHEVGPEGWPNFPDNKK